MSTLGTIAPEAAGAAGNMLRDPAAPDSVSLPGRPSVESAGLAGEVGACLPAIRVLGRQLSDTIRHVETSVVKVCQGFGGMAERARATVDETARQMEGEDGTHSSQAGFSGLVGQARLTLQHLLEGIEKSSAFSVSMSERVRSLAERVDTMKSSLTAMDAIADRARVLALNAKIEAARLGERGATFKVLASETADLSNKTGQASQALTEIVRELNNSSVRASTELRQQAEADRIEAAKSRGEVNGLLDLLTSTSVDLHSLVERSHAASKELARDIATAVTGLQFQDAVSQRVSHVVETLQEIEAALVARLGGAEAAARIADEQSPAQAAWVKRMSSRYTMAEEYGVLEGRTGSETANNVELF